MVEIMVGSSSVSSARWLERRVHSRPVIAGRCGDFSIGVESRTGSGDGNAALPQMVWHLHRFGESLGKDVEVEHAAADDLARHRSGEARGAAEPPPRNL